MRSDYQSEELRVQPEDKALRALVTGTADAKWGGNIGLSTVSKLWKRRKYLMSAVFLLVLAGNVLWIAVSPRAYESVVKIFVKRARIETLGGDRAASDA